jgi:hypothetical protein
VVSSVGTSLLLLLLLLYLQGKMSGLTTSVLLAMSTSRLADMRRL